MVEIATIEPASIVIGDTVKWKKSLSNYKASDGWTLKYVLKDVNTINITASASGDDYSIEISAATTAAWSAGTYFWRSYVEKAAEKYSQQEGIIQVKAGTSSISGIYEEYKHVTEVLTALEATIKNKASLDQLSYSINGRSLSRMTPDDVIKWRNFYRAEKAKLEKELNIARGVEGGGLIRVRFGR